MSAKPTASKRSVAKNQRPQTIDEYIAGFPPDVQQLLQTVRRTIREAAPGAEEVISYRIPGFKLHGYLIYFAGFKKHIGMYPARVAALKGELAAYQGGKGTVQFPDDQPLPLGLITRIVKHRVEENMERAAQKKSAAKAPVKGPVKKKVAKKPIETKKAAKKSVKKVPVKKRAAKKAGK